MEGRGGIFKGPTREGHTAKSGNCKKEASKREGAPGRVTLMGRRQDTILLGGVHPLGARSHSEELSCRKQILPCAVRMNSADASDHEMSWTMLQSLDREVASATMLSF